MKRGAQIAAAAAGGYVLGRSRKVKWALVLGGVAAGRALGTSPGELLAQQTKTLQSSPELSKLSEALRGPLLDAGKAAAARAASSQMESLTDRLNEQAEALRHPEPPRESASTEEYEPSEPEQGESDPGDPETETRARREERSAPRSRSRQPAERQSRRSARASSAGSSSRTGSASAGGKNSRTRGTSGSGSTGESRQASGRGKRRSTGSSGPESGSRSGRSTRGDGSDG